jgi:hypothetical protein
MMVPMVEPNHEQDEAQDKKKRCSRTHHLFVEESHTRKLRREEFVPKLPQRPSGSAVLRNGPWVGWPMSHSNPGWEKRCLDRSKVKGSRVQPRASYPNRPPTPTTEHEAFGFGRVGAATVTNAGQLDLLGLPTRRSAPVPRSPDVRWFVVGNTAANACVQDSAGMLVCTEIRAAQRLLEKSLESLSSSLEKVLYRSLISKMQRCNERDNAFLPYSLQDLCRHVRYALGEVAGLVVGALG